MEIKKISIIGLGLIGGSLAKALRRNNLNFFISAFDRPQILEQALNDKVIDQKLNNIEEALNSDLIFLCLPVDLSISAFKELIPKLKENQIITDVCGVKEIFHQIWNENNSKGFYIGGHPMTGKEKSGYENSESTLFENCVYILSDTAKEFAFIQLFTNIIHQIGARITFLNPKVHDIIVAAVSHLPQIVAVSLINSAALKDSDINFFDYAAGGFRDMTRIASSDFSIWESIIKLNNKNILQAIDNFIFNLEEIKKSIIKNDLKKIAQKFESARSKRDEIPKNTKGFLSPLHDIFVFVKDEPGVLSKITTALFHAGINIKDIELLKIREGTGGTFRISFESKDAADRAKNIIEELGFTTRI
ncbi:MAG: prephenate dehydrogenase/arogenate dehydrogenase family protein [Melioribacter sp.]|uniref:prephenate dehydrogenase/arogenate dehydrogenase family protein n=1 Tax=Rosettibacter primus TaxID=3111523 RepID=UPI00247E836E|nr:prephenate dehydrogenase/arogenate dehydrogenase family protein [Melioribacter sp.]